DDPHPHAPSSPAYKSYIVILRPPPEVSTMDDDARLSWYHSFLPSNLTDSGEPRITHTYKIIFLCFAAWLTETELDVMSKKPGFGSWIPDPTFKIPGLCGVLEVHHVREASYFGCLMLF
uniref:Inhibitor I9 domain-containing protein n=1 Tax=Setaria italica TaxID=4555 RepID=K3ZMZ3_SETIT